MPRLRMFFSMKKVSQTIKSEVDQIVQEQHMTSIEKEERVTYPSSNSVMLEGFDDEVYRWYVVDVGAVEQSENKPNNDTIYTHDEAMLLIDLFEDVLSRYDIHVPSPEDDEREPDNMVGLYGSVYSDLLDNVESKLIDLVDRAKANPKVITDFFSGTV